MQERNHFPKPRFTAFTHDCGVNTPFLASVSTMVTSTEREWESSGRALHPRWAWAAPVNTQQPGAPLPPDLKIRKVSTSMSWSPSMNCDSNVVAKWKGQHNFWPFLLFSTLTQICLLNKENLMSLSKRETVVTLGFIHRENVYKFNYSTTTQKLHRSPDPVSKRVI